MGRIWCSDPFEGGYLQLQSGGTHANTQRIGESFYADVWNQKDEAQARRILGADLEFRGSLDDVRYRRHEQTHRRGRCSLLRYPQRSDSPYLGPGRCGWGEKAIGRFFGNMDRIRRRPVHNLQLPSALRISGLTRQAVVSRWATNVCNVPRADIHCSIGNVRSIVRVSALIGPGHAISV